MEVVMDWSVNYRIWFTLMVVEEIGGDKLVVVVLIGLVVTSRILFTLMSVEAKMDLQVTSKILSTLMLVEVVRD
jgi:hypothetical protein